MFIYAFGSICRGEIDYFSDIDILIILDEYTNSEQFDYQKFSIYKKEKLKYYWVEGNPFAWHLYAESKLVYSRDNTDFLSSLGLPNKYNQGIRDLQKLYNIFSESYIELERNKLNYMFELATIFLSIRNFATCFALHNGYFNFARNAALTLKEYSLNIDNKIYRYLEQSRLLITRGVGSFFKEDVLNEIMLELPKIETWMLKLLEYTHE